MSATMLDSATVLMPLGTYSTTQSFTPLQVSPRLLAATMLQLSITSPPSAAATFTLEVASTSGGAYSVLSTLVWPAGTSGSRQVGIGANADLARALNTTSLWMRLSVVCSGAFTGSAWLAKPSDGGPGLGSRSYTLDSINAL